MDILLKYEKASKSHWVKAGIFCFFFFLFAFTNISGFTQNSDKWLKKGDFCFQQQEYPKAIEYYEWAAKDTSNLQALMGLGNSYRALSNYKKALPFYADLVQRANAPIKSFFYLGQCYMAAKEYDEAQYWFQMYALRQSSDSNATAFKNIDALVAMVKADSSEFEISKLPFNSNSSDFSPAFWKNGLLFASARPNDLGIIRTSTVNNAPLLDLYYVEVDTNNNWSRPKLQNDFNSNLNEGPLIYDKKNERLYLTRNDPEFDQKEAKENANTLNHLVIETYSFVDGKWRSDKHFPFNSPKYAVGHPALSIDSKHIIFASEQPGGYGGTDLYIADWENDRWTNLRNLGPEINTSGDELFPYIDSENLLYFSSNGHLGLGGLDLFFARARENGIWSSVENIGYPLNSEADDFGIIVDSTGNNGYFSSNRGDDPENDEIYAFKRSWPNFECFPQQANNYCFLFWETGVLDDDTLPLAYEWDFGDGTKARGLSVRHCFEGPGLYHVELNLVDTVAGLIFMNGVTGDYLVEDIKQVFIDASDAIELGQTLKLDASKSLFEGCEIEEYFWEINDGFRAKGMTASHLLETPGEYEIKLGVKGLPTSDGRNVCKKCVTKKVLVLSPEALKMRKDSIELLKLQLKPNPLINLESNDESTQILNSSPKVPEDPLGSLELKENGSEKYTVQLNDWTKPESFKNFDDMDLRIVESNGNFEYHSGLSDSLKGIFPYFKKAQENGFKDAIVIIVDSMGQKRPAIIIPAKKSSQGYTLFGGQVTDNAGNPIQVEISIEDLEKGEVLRRTNSDTEGKFEIRLENGKVYSWSTSQEAYFPANGLLDLRESYGNVNLTEKERSKIRLSTLDEVLENGHITVLENIFFDFDKHDLRPESYVQLKILARILRENPEVKIELSAHTDNIGDDEYNIALSNRRANAAMQYLISKGLDVSRVKSIGMGEKMPRVPNTSAENRQLNRRVEFKIIE